MIRSLLALLIIATPLLLAACSGDDAETTDEPAAAEEAPAAAEEAPAVEEAPAAVAGGPEAMMGDWGIALSADEQAQLDAAKAALEANPEDATSKMMVDMMTAMLEAMTITVKEDVMVMAMGEEKEEVKYEVATKEPLALKTTDKDGAVETINVAFNEDGTMTWTKEGDPKPLSLKRK